MIELDPEQEYMITRKETILFSFDNGWSIWNFIGLGGQRLPCVFCPCMRPVLDNTYYTGIGKTPCWLHAIISEEVLVTFKMIVGI